MNFEFSEEQQLLRAQARSFLQNECPIEKVRMILENDAAYDKKLWQGMVNLGWTAAIIPEEHGGLGLGFLELCVLAEELGTSLAPTPFASSVYLATCALLLFGTKAQKLRYLPALATGESIGCLALSEGVGPANAGNTQTTLNDDTISGIKAPVTDGDVADFAIVSAQDESGISLAVVDLAAAGVERVAVNTLDPTRSHAEITFNKAAADRLQKPGQGSAQLEALFDQAAVLFAFEQVGGAQASLDMAREYALGRYAFGRPIASFQAIKHKLADMYISVTLARSNCYYGAWALSTDATELATAAATARVSSTQAFHECSKENIQTHGGMGFTWEYNCHLYYRRNKLLAVNLGSLIHWQDKLISSLERSDQATA